MRFFGSVLHFLHHHGGAVIANFLTSDHRRSSGNMIDTRPVT